MLRVAGHLALGLTDAADGGGQPGGEHLNGLLNGAEVADKGGGGLHIEVALGQLLHNPVQVPDVAPDQLHRLFQGGGQIAQLVVAVVLQGQVQRAVVEGLHLAGDMQNGGQDVLQDIQHQADQADQRQHQANRRNALHQHDGGVHLLGTGLVQGGAQGDDIVQLAHQGGQVGLDGLLIVAPGLGRAGRHQVQHVVRRLVQRLMQRLHLAAQAEDLGVVGPRLSVDPLAQHTGGGVLTAGELGTGVQGVAQVRGPFIVGRLSCLSPAQQGDHALVLLLHPLHTDQVVGRDSAEQHN